MPRLQNTRIFDRFGLWLRFPVGGEEEEVELENWDLNASSFHTSRMRASTSAKRFPLPPPLRPPPTCCVRSVEGRRCTPGETSRVREGGWKVERKEESEAGMVAEVRVRWKG